ncbi:histone-lysine N-methyltransferase SETMAR [Trichonephila clavipes]|nr:histone-lysine N-methyltransferase SETMAR [Trichonephila clavipes]
MIQYKFGFESLKLEIFDVEDEPRSGRPIVIDCDQLKQIIDQDRNVSTRIIAVPHKLTSADKSNRKASFLALLRYQRKENILDLTVTCDEKWVYYSNTCRKGGWLAPRESASSVAK